MPQRLADRVASAATEPSAARPILLAGLASLATGVGALGVALVADGVVGDVTLAIAAPAALTGLWTTAAALARRTREPARRTPTTGTDVDGPSTSHDGSASATDAAGLLESANWVNIDHDEVAATVQRLELVAASIGAFIAELEAGFGGRPPVLAAADLRHGDDYPARGLELLRRHAGLGGDLSDELLAALHLATELRHAMRAAIADLEARRSAVVSHLDDDTSFRSLDNAVRAAFEQYADLRDAVSRIDELLGRVPRAPDRV